MFNWIYTETVKTAASPKQMWSFWSRPQHWPVWDIELEWVKMKDPFRKGATGTMKPKEGPVVAFELTTVEENHLFITCSKLPLTKIEFVHKYENKPEGSACIIHTVRMTGFLAPLFGRVIGSRIKVHMRCAMMRLSDLASSPNSDKSESKTMASAQGY